MLKLTWRHQLRLWFWQHRRAVTVTGFSLLAAMLTLWGNSLRLQHDPVLSLLTLAQLVAGAFIVLLVILLCD